MEGCFVNFLASCTKVLAHLHSRMADQRIQYSASKHAHMYVLIQLLIIQEKIIPGISTIWDHTDGCGKKYRYFKALYLLSVLACTYNIVIDICVGAPGHCKYVVGGINSQDRAFRENKLSL